MRFSFDNFFTAPQPPHPTLPQHTQRKAKILSTTWNALNDLKILVTSKYLENVKIQKIERKRKKVQVGKISCVMNILFIKYMKSC